MADRLLISALLLTFLSSDIFDSVSGQALTPPNFNLAVGRRIEATATCGVGVSDPELFCKLTGANPDKEDLIGDFEVIQGQLCDYCDPKDPGKTHLPEYAVDGTERWWQSPPLSRGMQYNEVNLTIALGQVFHVAYVFIKMGNSPRPGVFALERSNDNGRTWLPWQYFADTPSDCQRYFGAKGYSQSITRDDSVICTAEYSKVVPLEGGEIVVSLVNNRPSANNFSYSQSLQDWTRATNVRLRLLRTKTLLGHLMAVARQDPTVTRRYYYSIKDISIGGRCVCNGHADSCDMNDPRDRTKLVCRCQHNTCGEQCETCCPGFVQKPWRPATLDAENACEPCQCHGHTTECRYDEEVAKNRSSLDVQGNYAGGGVCINCQHNTAGINCEKCTDGYYRPFNVPLDSTRVCQRCRCDNSFTTGSCEDGTGRCICRPEYAGMNCDRCNRGYYGYPRCVPCQCNVNGTQGEMCEASGGRCPCKPNFDGVYCDRCATGYYKFPQCKPCACDGIGAIGRTCDLKTGQCRCRPKYGGLSCGQCATGFYNYPSCQQCNCNPAGCTSDVCSADTGSCICKENFAGPRCDRCAPGFYRFPQCIPCGCNEVGMQVNDCDNSGQCVCKPNFTGRLCDKCASGFHHYPQCTACNCDVHGSYGVSCDQQTGQCDCLDTFEGLTCNKCRPNYYNYPLCEECSCNPAGAKEVPGYPLGGCGAYSGGQLCECKERVAGRICDSCKPGFWNLRITNPDGCEDCGCNVGGTVGWGRTCDGRSGQCQCRPFVNSRRCDQCVDGTYNLQSHNPFGCQPCDCDVGGSIDQTCNKATGVCNCKPRVNGRRCMSPIATHYFPTLYHDAYELEDGHTPSGGAVRYGFDSRQFPTYSWRGYAVFSKIQEEVLVDVDIRKPSLYRIIYRYVNPTDKAVTADVTVTPESSGEGVQTSRVVFQPTRQPQFVTAKNGGSTVSTFVLNHGAYTVSLKTSTGVYVDYMVLLPEAYYGATILQEKVLRPCTVPASDGLCRHFSYVDVSALPKSPCSNGYYESERTELYDNEQVLDALEIDAMAHITNRQCTVMMDINVDRPDKYVLVLQYYTAVKDRVQELDIQTQTEGGTVDRGTFKLPGCAYSSLCRQPVLDSNGNVKEFTIDGSRVFVTLTCRQAADIAAHMLIAIPASQWSVDYVAPQFQCVRRDGQCIPGTFTMPTGTIRVDVEAPPNEDRVAAAVPPTIIDTTVKVIKLDRNLPTISVRATVTNPGKYVVVGHYYQPHIAGFDVDVNVLSPSHSYTGVLKTKYCPSVSGCRGVVHFKDVPDMQSIDLTDQDIRLIFNSSRPIWLDYIAIIPSVQFKAKILDVQDVDKSAEFITKCGANDFNINSSTTGFCREAVYSLTTDYNNGALRCQCSPDGSINFKCDEFGGQCRCKPNIIGRTCSHCRTGFYGFPNCRQCNCPSGLCDPSTGRCMCPPRVTGPNCDICLDQTFGFDPVIGCEDCACDPLGVVNNRMACDIQTGQCDCKANVAGRRCNKCEVGFSGFPYCTQCSCDERGVTSDICDQRLGNCLCKANVQGPQCSDCKPSSFYLEQRNPKGCTQCFCFGVTTRCEQSQLRRTQVSNMNGWGATNLRNPTINQRGRSIEITVNNADVIEQEESVYWIAPADYLGNKVTAYGGKLTYTVRFQIPRGGANSGVVHSDIRIEGNNLTIVHTATEQPEPGTSLTLGVDLLESEFVHEGKSSPVSREQLMTVLAGIRVLHIRASYYAVVSKIILSDVQLDIASSTGSGDVAYNVESCECPPNYIGTSCEQCAPGYYRSKEGPYLGTCVPCQCNDRADICDPESGACRNCRDNFEGPQCLACKRGYYYDDYYRMCKICSCPEPNEENNFAYTCEANRDGSMQRCVCMKGYTGARCDSCDIGFWGNPRQRGGKCQKCQCSGNIDLHDPLSCDQRTGQCLKCINNAAGDQCERCVDWYHGDAVRAKNCEPCQCDQLGSELCDHQSGACLCKPNVVGPNCDQCAPGHFGFESGRGCEPCNCGAASIGRECDVHSGQCRCQPGVTGRRCDQCERDYWNYGPRGCERCQCTGRDAVTCDPVSGACQCLPGVTGANCDSCLPRWVRIEGVGCKECDSCVHLLVDDAELVERNITTMINELSSISVGVLAMRRLERISSSVRELRPRVDRLVHTPTDPAQLEPIKRELEALQVQADRVSKKADRSRRESDLVEADASDVRIRAENLYDEVINQAVNAANGAVDYVKNVLEELKGNIGQTNVDILLRQAEDMLREIKSRDFYSKTTEAQGEMTNAVDALNRAKELMDKAMEQVNRTRVMTVRIEEIVAKLNDIRESSRISLDNSMDVARRNAIHRQTITDILEHVKEITIIDKEINTCHNKSRQLLEDARRFLQDATNAYKEVERELSRLDTAITRLDDHVNDLEQENIRLDPLVKNATEHAMKLRQQADLLDSVIADTRESAEGAVNASTAYQSIIDMINKAMNASIDAIRTADNAASLSAGHADEASKSKERSQLLKDRADETVERLESEVKPRLDGAERKVYQVENQIKIVREEITDIVLGLDDLPDSGYGEKAREAAELAETAQEKAVEAQKKVQSIVDKLPQDQEKVEQIPLDIDTANRYIKDAQSQVNKVQELVPQAVNLLNQLQLQAERIRHLGLELKGNISRLRSDVQVARNQANLIKVGVNFNAESQLWVQNPRNLLQAGSFSKVSMYFQTKGQVQDAFLLYIGPDAGPKITDYMALEIVNGFVQFKFDLGSGPAVITSTAYVSDDQWHEVIAERTGKRGKLTVRSFEKDNDEQEGESAGSASFLDLNHDTKFFIGGLLDKDVDTLTPDIVASHRFGGCIEDVKFDGVVVGLWNFMEAENIAGCWERDQLAEQLPKSVMFGGNGYIILAKGNFKPSQQSAVRFKFRTFAPNGLMFFMGQKPDYFSIELRDGKVVARYDLGSGSTTQQSSETYNDGQWHSLYMNRVKNDGILKVDDTTVASSRSPGSATGLDVDDNIYIGGYKGLHEIASVTNKGFEGCIKDVQLGQTSKDINDNKEFKDILPGCAEEARLVSFSQEVSHSYIMSQSIAIDSNFQMSLMFKTLQNDGLIFYASENAAQNNALSLSLVGGKLVVVHTAGGQRKTIDTTSTDHADGRWHYIVLVKSGTTVQLDVDDKETNIIQVPQRASRIATNAQTYFGGVPANYSLVQENVGSTTSFVGCISDVNIQLNTINFANTAPSNMAGVFLAVCGIPDPTPSPRPPPARVTRPTIAPPVPQERCRLPQTPLTEAAADDGIRFGVQPDSRYEYSSLPRTNNSGNVMRLEFKTTAANGLLFYVADKDHKDFVGLYMKNGNVGFAFNCGSGIGRGSSSPRQYNDGRWHTVVFARSESSGTLTVDSDPPVSFQSRGQRKTVEVIAPYFLGGLPKEVVPLAANNVDGVRTRFIGCIRGFAQDNVNVAAPAFDVGTEPCYAKAESGVFFYNDGGHLVLDDNFSVPLDFNLSMEVKPRTMAGVLFSVYSHGAGGAGGDFIILQMVNGSVMFTMDNSRGEVTSVYHPPAKNELCNGQWHKIKALKAKNVVTLEVDNVHTDPGIGPAAGAHTNTNDPVYLGGVPEIHRGVKTRNQYVGCIRNVAYEGRTINLSEARPAGRVNLGACPTE